MGASQSKQANEQVFYNTVPIQVSPELANQLADTSLSPQVSPARHAILDQDVRAKISAEAARLRGEPDGLAATSTSDSDERVDIVRREIEAALERENLDRERRMAGSGDAHGDVKNSTALLGDLEEVRQKVDRYRVRASLTELPEAKEAGEAVVSCYRTNPRTALNCWSEVAAFRGVVAKLEQVVSFYSSSDSC
ncbi:hypothetical protein F5148DRAFT_976832 [Russula earlei]|uniref:Uncharacterized protein n=1 Tax=Russula earlei TaxID=71964 RepID=A0ACC0UHQ4_9AGAM|nr:hypothetical protein F5148DRAFT_976832 [Russula earlei]